MIALSFFCTPHLYRGVFLLYRGRKDIKQTKSKKKLIVNQIYAFLLFYIFANKKIRIPLYIYERLPKNKSEYITSLLEREMKK